MVGKVVICVMLVMAIVVVGFGYGADSNFFNVMDNMLLPLEKIASQAQWLLSFFSTKTVVFNLDDVIDVYELPVRPLFGGAGEEYVIYLGALSNRKDWKGTKNVGFLGCTTNYSSFSLDESNLGANVHVTIHSTDRDRDEVFTFDLRWKKSVVMTYRDFLINYSSILKRPS